MEVKEDGGSPVPPTERPATAFERIVPFVSWTFAIAVHRKRGREGAARTAVIARMNRLYLTLSVILALAIVFLTGNTLAALQWAPGDGAAFRIATFVLASYCMSRAIEVLYAFYRDAFAKLAEEPSRSDLDGHRRIRLALASYLEMILNFGMLLALIPKDGWQCAAAPSHLTDVLFYSASTITTSGGGGFVPKGVVVQALTTLEIACGLILLVVCFGVYAADRTAVKKSS